MSTDNSDHVRDSEDRTKLDTNSNITESINGVANRIQQQIQDVLLNSQQIDHLAKSLQVAAYIQGLQKICEEHSTTSEHSARILLLEQLHTSLLDLDVKQYSSLFVVQADERNYLDFALSIHQLELLTRIAKRVGGTVTELVNPWLQQVQGKRIEKKNGEQFCQQINALADAAHCFLLYRKEKIRLYSRDKKAYASTQFRCLKSDKHQNPAIESTQFPLLWISNIDVE